MKSLICSLHRSLYVGLAFWLLSGAAAGQTAPGQGSAPGSVQVVEWKDQEFPTPFYGVYTGRFPEYPILHELQIPGKFRRPLALSWKETDHAAPEFLPDTLWYELQSVIIEGVRHRDLSLLPYRKGPGGRVQVLEQYGWEILSTDDFSAKGSMSSSSTRKPESVLATGDWYKIRISGGNGAYKITRDLLNTLGLNPNTTDPDYVKVFGGPGGMLPELNNAPRQDDLEEFAVQVIGGGDGRFDAQDAVIFYARGSDQWTYDPITERFAFQGHLYAGESYAFVTVGTNSSKRMAAQGGGGTPTVNVAGLDGWAHHEKDLYNNPKKTVSSGRVWWGEEFGFEQDQTFTLPLENLDPSEQVWLAVDVMAHSEQSSSFKVYVQGVESRTLNLSPVSFGYDRVYGSTRYDRFPVSLNGAEAKVRLVYSRPHPSSFGYLNYIELNYRKRMEIMGNSYHFRDRRHVGAGVRAQFRVTAPSNSYQIWDVTNPTDPLVMKTTWDGSTLSFVQDGSVLREYLAVLPAGYMVPTAVGKIKNQNLHALDQPGMVIVTHPDFYAQSQQLAAFKNSTENWNTVVVLAEEIYNEFSAGTPDLTAIRDFMKMFYDRAGGDANLRPKYLLLMGDGSHDNRSRVSGNKNYLPTYQSLNSLSPTDSYVSDDYLGLLDDGEGNFEPGTPEGLDLAIGRLPVRTPAEASAIISKIIRYRQPASFGSWRNNISMIADDEDTNTHINQVEDLAREVADSNTNLNIRKIYLDAYKQLVTPAGNRYPEVNEQINRDMDRGSLIMNYTGHGGGSGWAHERILGIPDIQSWSNFNKLCMIFTATCSFSQWDHAESISPGELAILNPNGGAIALFTTVRLVYASDNYKLNLNFYRSILRANELGRPTLGEVFKITKNTTGMGLVNTRNFTLLGDPSLRIAFPELEVRLDSINGRTPSAADTIKSLEWTRISGSVLGMNGQPDPSFNGQVEVTVFDRPGTQNTLVNDPKSLPKTFAVQNNILFRGLASVQQGQFNLKFMLPKDISYGSGMGKISLYAWNTEKDGGGYFNRLNLGGISDTAVKDNSGPVVKIYLEDEKFVAGSMVSQEPLLLVRLADESGINTSGAAIGHNLSARLQKGTEDKFTEVSLNDYYLADENASNQGQVRYPMSRLEPGNYQIKVEAWDVANQRGEGQTHFVVAEDGQLKLEHVFNYPNPFTTSTGFGFEHNRPGDLLQVMVQVYTPSGRLIKSIQKNMSTVGTRIDFAELPWDGRDDFGDRIGRGTYLFKLSIQDSQGEKATEWQKLVILK